MARRSLNLIQCGKARHYFVRYMKDGRRVKKILLDDSGNPIIDRRIAELAAEKILSIVRCEDQKRRTALLRLEVESTEERAARLERRLKEETLSLDRAWKAFISCPSRPSSCFDGEARRNTTAGNYRMYLSHFVEWMKETFPDVKSLANVTQEHASAYQMHLLSIYSRTTANKYLQFLKCLFNTLIEDERLEGSSPFRKVRKVQAIPKSKMPFTPEQMEMLLKESSGEMRCLIQIGYYTGLRLGDCCTLRWDELNLEKRVLVRTPRKTRRKGTQVKIGLSQGFLDSLPERGSSPYVLPTLAEKYLEGRSYEISKEFQSLLRRCGILPKTATSSSGNRHTLPEYGFHSLRYTYISRNAELGVPASVIQANAGHSSPAMTEHYTKVSDEAAVRFAERYAGEERQEKRESLPEEKLRQIMRILNS